LNGDRSVVRRRFLSRWLPDTVALAGIVAFGFHSYGQIFGQTSVLDEGLYLFKGLLFVKGIYRPFQEYGPWTNHMPFSFLIPGWVQATFGEGLGSGRFFALSVGIVMMVLLWRTSRREGNPGWAALAVWAIALNAALVKIYSQAISQGLVLALLMGILYFGLGGGRKLWQIAVASTLAGVLWMTRINLLPVLPLLVIYLWISHGRRVAVLGSLAGGGIVLLGHAIFWPDILRLWANWLPRTLTPFLRPWRDSAGGVDAWQVHISGSQAWGIVVSTIRRHLVPVTGAIWAGLTYPGRPQSPEEKQRARDALFIGGLMIVLAVIHGYAALAFTYCPFCLTNYLAFFSPIGLVLVAVAGAHWLPKLSQPRRYASLAFLILVPLATGLPLDGRLATSILSTQIPRISRTALRPGTIELGDWLNSSVGLSQSDSATWVSVGFALALLLALASGLGAFLTRRRPEVARRLLATAGATLAVLILTSATIHFGNQNHDYDCGQDVVGATTTAGEYLRRRIPAGALVYWGVNASPVPLLYLQEPRLFPAQLNGIYTFRLGGDPTELARFGFWNQPLAEEWIGQADFVLVDVNSYNGWLAATLSPDRYDEITRTPPPNPCQPNSAIMIFRRTSDGS
jgi:hypothetical protein